jgi:hypothetical protein
MANLLSQNIGTNYKSILNLDATTINTPLDATLRAVTDGMGTSSPLQLSTRKAALLMPNLLETTGTLTGFDLTRSITNAAGNSNYRQFNNIYTINNSGAQTGNITGIFLNATETALNGMTHNLIDLQVGGTSRFLVSRTGVLSIGNNLEMSGSQIIIAAQNRIVSNSSGVMMLVNNGFSDFSRLQFGGTTTSFPAIKRNGAAIDFRLADDSAFAAINTGSISCTSNLGVTTSMSLGGQALFGLNDLGSLTASAVLEARSTTKGFLPPRMTGAQADTLAAASPAQGLMIFVTSTSAIFTAIGWWGYNGTSWVQL